MAARLEWHYTPKHGSWLNIAVSEFAALAAQCLDRRIASEAVLEAEITVWVQQDRNALGIPVNWHVQQKDLTTAKGLTTSPASTVGCSTLLPMMLQGFDYVS